MNNWLPRRRELIVVALVTVALGAVLKITFGNMREKRRQEYCFINLRQLGLAMMQYTRNYDEKLPPAKQWNEALLPYTKDARVARCPSVPLHGYAMNRYLDRISYAAIFHEEQVPLIFDSTLLQPNAFDAGESLPQPGRHHNVNNVVYFDGHVKWLSRKPVFSPIARGKRSPLLP